MLIYNTFSKKKEEFKPLNPPTVTMYMCGPTVYDYFHIGNARSFTMADIVRRYLDYKGYKVRFIMNVTDIDDKLIKKSHAENKSTDQIAKFYSDAFLEDIAKLKIKKAEFYPHATMHISEIISLIVDLEKAGIAYNVEGNVFYDVSKFKEYGKLSGKNIDELESGSRIEVNDQKKNPLDFTLWKKAKEGEPSWDSPWGKGRPGWHIECSAMSMKHLGQPIDIHAGGNDLIFPHHENEIAQSEAANGKKFVHYWLHFGFLNLNEEKMSKSLGNFFTAREILSKYSAEAVRSFFAQTYYGGPLNFSLELLAAAEKGIEKIKNLAERVQSEIDKNNMGGTAPEFDIHKYYGEFEKAMDDDFNSPQAMAVMFDFARAVNKRIAENENLPLQFFENVKAFLKDTAEGVLGIVDFNLPADDSSKSLQNDLLELLIAIRETLKSEKNYKLADQIRNKLNELGVVLQDSKSGTTYKIKN